MFKKPYKYTTYAYKFKRLPFFTIVCRAQTFHFFLFIYLFILFFFFFFLAPQQKRCDIFVPKNKLEFLVNKELVHEIFMAKKVSNVLTFGRCTEIQIFFFFFFGNYFKIQKEKVIFS